MSNRLLKVFFYSAKEFFGSSFLKIRMPILLKYSDWINGRLKHKE
jgi:hypothetical protein